MKAESGEAMSLDYAREDLRRKGLAPASSDSVKMVATHLDVW